MDYLITPKCRYIYFINYFKHVIHKYFCGDDI